MRWVLGVWAVVALPVVAWADGFERPYWTLTAGMDVGDDEVGNVDGAAVGGALSVGRTWLRTLNLSVSYAPLAFSETDAKAHRDAFVQHLDVVGRWAPLSMTPSPMFMDLFVEAGFGHEWVDWKEGGKLGRTETLLGIGSSTLVAYGASERKKLGMTYEFRFSFARDPLYSSSEVPTCAGPCDRATRPWPVDVAFQFLFTLDVGRTSW